MSISVIVLTYNRVHLLQQCVEKVLSQLSDKTSEILIWDNGSEDGTRRYLDSLEISRLSVVHSETNLGLNAYDPAIHRTTGDYIIGLDEDVIAAPAEWDRHLMEAFCELPTVGFLATNLVNNPNDVTSQIMYGKHAPLYRIEERGGVRVKTGGPVGGWCALTSRELYSSLGGIGRRRHLAYWHWDEAYIKKIQRVGFEAAILENVAVVHAGGEYYSAIASEKQDFWTWRERRTARRRFVKRALLRVPGVGALNAKFRWFEPPPSADHSRGIR